MIKNYFKTAWRNLMRHKIFTLINIFGLSIGICASLVIFLIVQFDFGFDHFEKDNDRIYRVVTNFDFSGTPSYNEGVSAPLAQAVKAEATGVDEVAPFHQYDDEAKVSIPSTHSNYVLTLKKQGDIILADAPYFKMIGYQWLAGSAITALNEPYKVVITQSRAQLYFPGIPLQNIIGRRIIYNDTLTTTVTGVVKDVTEHTDFTFHDFISLATIPAKLSQNFSWGNWGSTNGSSQLYIKLSPGTTVQHMEDELAAINKKYCVYHGVPFKYKNTYKLQPFSDVHFNSKYGNYGGHLANKTTLYSLLIVGGFLLILGCINFVNLSTAQASQRAKEIGVRKTMGSSKAQLITQFLSETFLITTLATMVSVIFVPLLLKLFSNFIPQGVVFNPMHQPGIFIFLALLIFFVSFVSGLYPAFILSAYNPVMVLKNQTVTSSGNKIWVRKSLTIFQFLVAQVFIMGTLIVSKQIYYTLHKDLGFKKDAIITVQTPFFDKQPNRRFVFMDKLKAIPEIELMSIGSGSPSSNGTSSSPVSYNNGKREMLTQVQIKKGDTNYLKLYHIPLLAGRNARMSDTINELVINETYLRFLGFNTANSAVGKMVLFNNAMHPIVGVMADFNQQSLHKAIVPLMFTPAMDNSYQMHIALKPQNADATLWKSGIGKVQAAFKTVYPETDFEYKFYDETIAKFYEGEQNMASLLKWATGLAIFISCLGLLGLVIYTTNLRTKEIGIRKVLGASVAHIVAILSREFVLLVLLAFVIATPLAWWGTQKWLQGFAYRTNITWFVFLAGGLIMIVIALVTLSFQTMRAAMANPVKSLKNE